MTNKISRKLRPKANSLKGKIIQKFLGFFYTLLHIFKKSRREPKKNFEENPKYMGKKGAIYLGYKYYYNPHTTDGEKGEIANFFKTQKINKKIESNFNIKNRISIGVGGDLMSFKTINNNNCKELRKNIGEYYFNNDIVFANLETPININHSPIFHPELILNDVYMNASKEIFNIFNGNNNFKGLDIVSTANNHSLDMGEKGLTNTMNFLEENGIFYTGTSKSKEINIPIIEKKGIKVAFLAYTYSLNQLDTNNTNSHMVNHIRLNLPNCDLSILKKHAQLAKKKGADIIVTSVHMGNAYQAYPSKHIIETYHRIFSEVGSDIILGTHPHNPQPMERFDYTCPFSGKSKSGFAIYSLGNFIADDILLSSKLSIIINLKIAKGEKNGEEETLIEEINWKPIYNWKSNKNKNMLQLVDLNSFYKNIWGGNRNHLITKNCEREISQLHKFYYNLFLPQQD